MKTFAFLLILVVYSSVLSAQNHEKETKRQTVDVDSADFLFTVSPESTQEDVDEISDRLTTLGVKHSLKITKMSEDGMIESIEFRQYQADGTDGLGCYVGTLRKWTLRRSKGVLSCKSE